MNTDTGQTSRCNPSAVRLLVELNYALVGDIE